ncbi:9463_t:CDS:10 [Paraglomus occultum]|uniref:9463_t:CDS:1 n=1 Tax=Paraglomus occultum TaxID=144539 RepID=A0A9N9F003_9GLOM|nr:9463_t:CDS:10 [Paraglomus occultum]
MQADTSEPGFGYFLNTPCQAWDAVRYHEAWEDNKLGLDKATLTRCFQKQIQIIKSQGTEEEKENATRLEKQFKVGIIFVSYNNCRLVATFSSPPLLSPYFASPILQLPMELRLRMAESKKAGLIDNFWSKRRNLMKHESMMVNSTFVSCDGVQIGCIGNNQGQKRSYENREQSTERRKKQKPIKTTIGDGERRTSEREIHTSEQSVEDESAEKSNDHYESDAGIVRDGDNNPFIAQTGKDSTKYKIVLSWSHAIDNVAINNVSENDWLTQDGYNISTDFRKFQEESIKKLEINPTLSYAKEIDTILCLSSIMYCNELKPEYLGCSGKTWNEARPRPLTPKELPTVADLVIIEYSRLLNDKQSLNTKWRNNWAKGNTLTDEDKGIFDCVQIVSRNLANGESESSKERRLLDGHNHGRKPDFRILSKIDDTEREFVFGEIKPHSPNTINKTIVKLAEFMKESLDFIIDIHGYVAGLEMYGILICGSEIKIFSIDLVYDGLYRCNLLSKVLFPTESANFLNIITVVSTLYSLLERARFTIDIMNSAQLTTESSSPRHSYCRNSNSSPKKIRVPVVRVN